VLLCGPVALVHHSTGLRYRERCGIVQDSSNSIFHRELGHLLGKRHNGVVKVLLVEDDVAIAESVSASLVNAGMSVHHSATGADAIVAAKEFLPEVILMDLGLPDMDGLDVSKSIREFSTTPIIIVSARGDELDRVLGLELGADDYVVKPFSQRELLARIKAVTRRGHDSHVTDVEASSTRVVIDERTHSAMLDGEEVVLTAKEFDLLAFLSSEPGVVFRRNDILEHVWDTNWYGTTKTLDAHIASIRKKLGSPDWIQAVRGVGFKFVEVPQ
jgi:DNA-binding response OmpR family regulator